MQLDDDLVGRPLRCFARSILGKPYGTLDRLHVTGPSIRQVNDQ